MTDVESDGKVEVGTEVNESGTVDWTGWTRVKLGTYPGGRERGRRLAPGTQTPLPNLLPSSSVPGTVIVDLTWTLGTYGV